MFKEYTFKYSDEDEVLTRDFFQLFPTSEQWESRRDLSSRGGGFFEVVVYTGTAVLSSAAIAAAIKSWIEGRRRKVIISSGDKRLEYEGPDLGKDLPEIERMIERLAQESDKKELMVRARALPEQQVAETSDKDSKDHSPENDECPRQLNGAGIDK